MFTSQGESVRSIGQVEIPSIFTPGRALPNLLILNFYDALYLGGGGNYVALIFGHVEPFTQNHV